MTWSRSRRRPMSSSRSATTSSIRTTGRARCCAKEVKEVLGESREYLTIKILHNDMTVMVPTENARLPACAG